MICSDFICQVGYVSDTHCEFQELLDDHRKRGLTGRICTKASKKKLDDRRESEGR